MPSSDRLGRKSAKVLTTTVTTDTRVSAEREIEMCVQRVTGSTTEVRLWLSCDYLPWISP